MTARPSTLDVYVGTGVGAPVVGANVGEHVFIPIFSFRSARIIFIFMPIAADTGALLVDVGALLAGGHIIIIPMPLSLRRPALSPRLVLLLVLLSPLLPRDLVRDPAEAMPILALTTMRPVPCSSASRWRLWAYGSVRNDAEPVDARTSSRSREATAKEDTDDFMVGSSYKRLRGGKGKRDGVRYLWRRQ
jgi:hypothetical protein